MSYCIGAAFAVAHTFKIPVATGLVAVAVLIHLISIEEKTGGRK
jgi:hypothetical protein